MFQSEFGMSRKLPRALRKRLRSPAIFGQAFGGSLLRQRISGFIVENGCLPRSHGLRGALIGGHDRRTESMYGLGGTAYVFFVLPDVQPVQRSHKC